MDTPDLRAPVHIGVAYSAVFQAPALSIGIDLDVGVLKLSERFELRALLGMDGQNSHPLKLFGKGSAYTMLGFGAGAGLAYRPRPQGPAFEVSVLPQAIVFENAVKDFGVGVRLDAFPFYLPLGDLPSCEHGTFVTYVLSGASLFVLGRYDQIRGVPGASVAIGLSFDYGRSVIAPIVSPLTGGGFCSH